MTLRMFRGPDFSAMLQPVPTGTCTRCRRRRITIYRLIDINGVRICWDCTIELKAELAQPPKARHGILSDEDTETIVTLGRNALRTRGRLKIVAAELAEKFGITEGYATWLAYSTGKRSR